jgi:hypothetical protein
MIGGGKRAGIEYSISLIFTSLEVKGLQKLKVFVLTLLRAAPKIGDRLFKLDITSPFKIRH